MKVSGAHLAVRALENVGVRFTFGVPGVHNTELYDELARSERITPILVTHEGAAGFMADAVSRTSDGIGCLVIVPAAGVTHAMSGIGEAFLDGVPLLVVSGGVRSDSGRAFQLHAIDQKKLVQAVTKAAFVVERHEDIVPTLYRAYEIATSGEPGPVFVELASNVQLFTGPDEVAPYARAYQPPAPRVERVDQAVALLAAARKPGLYLGWGARDATAEMVAAAERLAMPVATTLQGLSVFPADHPLHTGMGFGPSSVPAAREAFKGCDALLAVGLRFAELATGSYGLPVPDALVHVDINPDVFDKNYKTAVAIESDAKLFGRELVAALDRAGIPPRDGAPLAKQIAGEKADFLRGWTGKANEKKVGPGVFFHALRRKLARDAYVVVDDGNHTFLAAELMPVYEPRHFISPTDFNCMGYCVPAAIGVKLTHPGQQVAAIVGDGAFLMTAMEILTAAMHKLGIMYFVFHDGELAQISQFQHVPLKYKTCTVLGDIRLEGVATATGAAYLRMENDAAVDDTIDSALALSAQGTPVVVDVAIDYSRKSEFTKGVLKVNLGRFPLEQKLRFIARALKRHTIG